MSLVIRRADLTSDRNTIIDILNRNIPTRQHAAIYEWLYRNNPYGPAETWLAVNSNTGAAVGTASVFPRPVMLNRKSIPGGLVGDFAIDAGFRSLGPAVLLQKETITPVSEGRMAITFDAPPDERGMSTFRRMGIPAVGRMLRFAKPMVGRFPDPSCPRGGTAGQRRHRLGKRDSPITGPHEEILHE